MFADAAGNITRFSDAPDDLRNAQRLGGRAILPGLVNGHSHAFQRALRGRTEGEPSLIRFGRLKIDRDAHRAWVDEDEIALTALEFRLLHAFMSRRGRVQTREALLSDVWGIEADVTTRTVDTHVKRLREKLGEAGMYIETLRGVGYRFKDAPDEAA